MAIMPSCPIDRLPNELFWIAMLQVRNTCDVSALLSCLLVCRRWRDAVLPLLCRDIRITNSNLEIFNTQFKDANGRHVRSLTLSIDSVFPVRDHESHQPSISSMEEMEY